MATSHQGAPVKKDNTLMGEFASLVEKIPKGWQVLLTIVGILGVGFTGGMSFVNLRGLPEVVAQQEERLANRRRSGRGLATDHP